MKTNDYFLHIILAMLLCCARINAYAYDIAVQNSDGVTIYYNYINDGTELEVKYGYYGKYSGVVNIPSQVTYQGETMSVTSIGECAFSDCSGLTSVTIPNSVTSIGSYAFSGCSGLTSVTIGNSVTSIGEYAFSDCSGLTSVTIGNSVTSIGYYAFRHCSGLTSIVVVPENTCYDSRDNCNAIIETATGTLIFGCQTTIIPNSVTSIGESAFSGCTGLTSVTIPNSVTSIGYDAFYDCTGLTSVTIPNSVTSIGSCAFSGCSGLTSVTIPNSVTSIESYAFSGCSGLTSLTIPNSVTSIGVAAFYDCYGLTSLAIGNSVTSIGNSAFYDCHRLTSVIIPNSVTSIGNQAFYNCSGLTSVTIGNSVTSIGNSAFYDCTGLTSLTIPNSVTSIGEGAFYDCYRLNTINCLNPVPPTCNAAIFLCYSSSSSMPTIRDKYDVYTYANLHVPMGSKEVYSGAYEWRYFNKIKEDMEANGNVFYANLTVKQGTTGYTRQAVKADEKYTIYIGSLGENKVNSVSFNGVDVTDELVNGYYTTPEITAESTLSVTYETNVTGISSTTINNDVKVIGYNGEIIISQIEEPSDVQIYSVDGKIIDSRSSAFGSVTIQVPEEQLYLVKVGSRTYKVAL